MQAAIEAAVRFTVIEGGGLDLPKCWELWNQNVRFTHNATGLAFRLGTVHRARISMKWVAILFPPSIFKPSKRIEGNWNGGADDLRATFADKCPATSF